MTTLTIKIPDDLKSFIDEKVESGDFSDAGDFLAVLIYNSKVQSESKGTLEDHAKLAALRTEVAIGIAEADQGDFEDYDEESIIREWPARMRAQI